MYVYIYMYIYIYIYMCLSHSLVWSVLAILALAAPHLGHTVVFVVLRPRCVVGVLHVSLSHYERTIPMRSRSAHPLLGDKGRTVYGTSLLLLPGL